MEPIPTFWTEQTGFDEVRLRRYLPDPTEAKHCTAGVATVHNDVTYWPFCSAISAPVFEVAPARFIPAELSDGGGRYRDGDAWTADEFAGHHLWPIACDACGSLVDDLWVSHVQTDSWYKADGLGQWTHRNLPAGAMFDAWWLPDAYRGADGIALTVMVPSDHGPTDWHVDSQASNCTRPGEPHKCWCRHGSPRTGRVHVDKQCDTCAAGAGSIQVPGWHGFLHDGALV